MLFLIQVKSDSTISRKKNGVKGRYRHLCKDTLEYDFATEKQFSYEGLSADAFVKHMAKFASDIW